MLKIVSLVPHCQRQVNFRQGSCLSRTRRRTVNVEQLIQVWVEFSFKNDFITDALLHHYWVNDLSFFSNCDK